MTCLTCGKAYIDNGRVLRKACKCKRPATRMPMRRVYTVKDAWKDEVRR